MTKIINNPLLKGATGKMGGTMIYKNWQGQVIMANMPAKRRVISEKQKASSERFRKANIWAKHMMTIPEQKAEYAKKTTLNKNAPHRVAVTDYLNPPVVHYVKAIGYSGSIGDIITIKATDDFKVQKVSVFIRNASGVTLERGDATQNGQKKYMWNYRTTVENKNVAGTVIEVIAYDKPGHSGVGEIVVGGGGES